MSAQLNCKKRLQYRPEAMAMAIQMVKSGQMSKKLAAKSYGVPKTTLLDKLAGRVPEEPTRVGRKTVLTPAEELTLVGFINIMSEIGYPLTRNELLNEVQYILNIDGRNTPFLDNRPGKDWFTGFLRWHPGVSFRKPMSLGHKRSIVTLEKVQAWFDGVSTYLDREFPEERERLLNDPRRIFNADESGFP